MLAKLARTIAPPHCLVCSREGMVVCEHCLYQNCAPPPPTCFRCNKNSSQRNICNGCQDRTALNRVVVGAPYDGLVRELIAWLKYRRLREVAGPLAALLTPLLRSAELDIVTAVPVATSRRRTRGYNQSELIACRLAHSLQLPYRPLLRRRRNTQQVGKTRAQRQAEVHGAFAASQVVSGQRILIVDDVTTTGATLEACAAALAAAGAVQIQGAVIAREA